MTRVRTIPCCVCGRQFKPVRPGVLACSRICGAARKAGKSCPPCRHGLHVEACRECPPCGLTVAEFVAAFPEPSLEEIGAALDVTRQRVEQIEKAALARAGLAPAADLLEDLNEEHEPFAPESAWDATDGGFDA